MKIHHIGYLVEDIGTAIEEFKNLGYHQSPDGVVKDDFRGILICFMQMDGLNVELVSPTSEQSSVSGILKKKKAGPYHICYLSEQFAEDIQALTQQGFMVIQPPAPAIALQSKSVAFLYSSHSGIIELLEN